MHPELFENRNILVRQWTRPTKAEWQAGERGAEFSNPVLVQNTLVFGNQSVGLISLYPGLNQVRWVLPIEGGVMSELAVSRDSVYFGGGDGYLYSVNLDTGHVNWRYQVRTTLVSRPTLAGGRLLVTSSDDTVYAFDAGSGQWLWHYRRRSSAPATIHAASAPLVDGNEVIAGLSDGFLVALSINDGNLKWERKLHQGRKFTDVDAHPVLSEGVIYVPSYDGALYALRRIDGETIWRFDAGGSKQIREDGDKLFLPSSDGSIYALQKDSAKVLWKFELDGGVPTQLVLTDRFVMAGSSYQYFYVIDRETGKGLYRFNLGSQNGFLGAPAYDPASQRVYILSGAGNLYCFAIRQPRRNRPHGMTDPYVFASSKP